MPGLSFSRWPAAAYPTSARDSLQLQTHILARSFLLESPLLGHVQKAAAAAVAEVGAAGTAAGAAGVEPGAVVPGTLGSSVLLDSASAAAAASVGAAAVVAAAGEGCAAVAAVAGAVLTGGAGAAAAATDEAAAAGHAAAEMAAAAVEDDATAAEGVMVAVETGAAAERTDADGLAAGTDVNVQP